MPIDRGSYSLVIRVHFLSVSEKQGASILDGLFVECWSLLSVWNMVWVFGYFWHWFLCFLENCSPRYNNYFQILSQDTGSDNAEFGARVRLSIFSQSKSDFLGVGSSDFPKHSVICRLDKEMVWHYNHKANFLRVVLFLNFSNTGFLLERFLKRLLHFCCS